MAATERLFGSSIKRREDPRLITGKGVYVDDVKLPATTYASFVRSPRAHARIKAIDSSAARKLPGVVAVYTGKELSAGGVKSLPVGWLLPNIKLPPHLPLAVEQDGAGAALARVASDVRAGEHQRLAEEVDEQEPRLDLASVARSVDGDGDGGHEAPFLRRCSCARKTAPKPPREADRLAPGSCRVNRPSDQRQVRRSSMRFDPSGRVPRGEMRTSPRTFIASRSVSAIRSDSAASGAAPSASSTT